MLMRSEWAAPAVDCEDALVKSACLLDAESCPAACKTTDEPKDEEPTVVKSGDLAVTAKAAADRKILINGISDLDTLTFRTSEEVSISKVVLERYGYSTNEDVEKVWLENENGTVISSVYEGLDSKGQAKLTILKDYRTIDWTYNATIVVSAKWAAGKTMWFKVVDVDSTAKNLNVDNYNPYTYEMVNYSWASVTFTIRGTSKDYNWEEGKLYEVSKFKVKAPSDSSILVKGFTLSMTGSDTFDLRRYLDKAELTVDGKSVRISYEVNKDDKLVIALSNDVELAAKDNVEFVVSASFGDNFYNEYNKTLQLGILEEADFSAIDSKTNSRVKIDTNIKAASWPTYKFNGGKVKLSNVRLGNVDWAQGSVDVVIAEGNITVPEDIKGTLVIQVKDPATTTPTTWAAYAIQALRIVVAGDEYEGKLTASGTNYYPTTEWTFSNVEVVKSGKVQVKADIRDVSYFSGAKLTFSFLTGFDTFNYVEGKKPVDMAGSMSFSQLTIQAAKASLTNSLTKAVEFRNNEVNRKVVFDGEYTAKKGDLKLNEFIMSGSNNITGSKVTFYLSIDGDEVADVKLATGTNISGGTTFSNVEIDAGKTVKVVVEAEVDAKAATGTIGKFTLTLKGEDSNGNVAGEASRATTELKIVEVGAVNVSTSTSKKTIVRRASNVVVAEFAVKPANGGSSVDLEDISFTLSGVKAAGGNFTADDVTLTIDGVSEDSVGTTFHYQPTTTVESAGVVVKVELNEEAAGTVEVKDLYVNNKLQGGKEFSKSFYPAVVTVTRQENLDGTTRYTLSVDKDSDVDVRAFTVYASGDTITGGIAGEFSDGDRFSIAGTKDVVSLIDKVTYEYSDSSVAGSCSDGTSDETTCPTVVKTPASYHTWNAAVMCTDADVADTAITQCNATTDVKTPGSCSDGTSDETTCPTVVKTPATYHTWNAGGYTTVTVEKSKLTDYFKIWSNEEDLKIFKL